MSSNLVKGTAILSIGLFLSKALGLLYVIPLYAMVGEENLGLYQYAYIPYNIMLSFAISGMPIAVSRYVSKYNSLGDYEAGRKLLRSSQKIMIGSGVVAFLLLFFLADPIAQIVRASDEQVFTVDDIAGVIRLVSFALIVVPFMSLTRGFFQGYQQFTPTAVSQLVEQIVRILFVLAGVYIVINFTQGSEKTAISFAVFAAFIGAVAGLAVLYFYWRREKPKMDSLLAESTVRSDIRLKDMYRELIVYIFPIVLVGLANPLFQLVDMLTFNQAMASIGLGSVSDGQLGMLNFSTHKIVMIPVMVGTAFSMAIIPIVTSYYTKGDRRGMTRSLDQVFQIIAFLTLPMITGLMILSDELYHLLFEQSETGADILRNYAPAALLFALYSVSGSILQAIDRHKWIILNLMIGLLLKLALNMPLIRMFEAEGAILATVIGYGAAVGLNIAVAVHTLHYRSRMVIHRLILIVMFNAVMGVAAWLVLKGLYLFGSVDGKGDAFLYTLITALVGAAVYAVLALRSGLAQKLFGDRLNRLMKKFRM